MKLLILSCLLTLTLAGPAPENYLTKVGIPLAKQIQAVEEATDFDGARIIGGSVSRLGLIPYIGGLVITLTTGHTAVCGSTLLTNTRLVTAAHCWYDGWNQARQFVVVLGSITLFTGGTRRTTTDVVLHDSWMAPFSIEHDIAMISINSVAYTANIRNIALPSGWLLTNDYTGSIVQAAGWGKQADAGTIPTSQQLRYVTLQVLNNAACQTLYGDVFVGSMMCVSGSGGRSTCNGDSGGPLAYNNGGIDVLIGISSIDNHRDGCDKGYPVVFTRVTSYLSWILEHLY